MQTLIITNAGSTRAAITDRVADTLNAKIVYSSIQGDIVQGWSNGHLMALTDALNYDEVLVLEDDADFTPHHQPSDLSNLTIPADADAIYLGLSKFGYDEHTACVVKYEIVDDDYVKLESMLTTHAILYISNRYKHHTLEMAQLALDRNFPIDVLLARAMKRYNVYALRSPMFYQNCIKHEKLTLFEI